jgi:transcriptional antiterminator RfaH
MARTDFTTQPSAPNGSAWFCIQSHPKHEHIAAAHLRLTGLEVYLPRIRFQRATRRGIVWFTEALFPNYLFARFELATWLRRLNHLCGVQDVVHFGNQWPAVPEAVIDSLRAVVQEDEAHFVRPNLQVGDRVWIATGAFDGLNAVVTRVLPARQRVAVLLEFLGNQTTLELPIPLVRTEPDKCNWSL